MQNNKSYSQELPDVDAIDLDHRRDMLSTPPTESNLHSWIDGALGIWIPKYKICDDHCTPYEHLHDRYFDKFPKTIALANRGGGKSYNTGLECWLKARFKPKWGAIILGGSLDQSEKSYAATEDFWNATRDVGGEEALLTEPNSKITKFQNLSWYKISTASTKSAHGPHQPALYLDEIDEMERDVLNGALMQPQTMNRHQATWSFTSTRHKSFGLMSEWVDNADVRGYKLYTWCVLEVMEACVDYHCSTCELHEWCGGRMKPVIEEAYSEQVTKGIIDKGDKPLMGFNTVDDTISKVKFAEGKTFSPETEVIDVEADLFCRKPSRQGLVYKEYEANVHGVADIKLCHSLNEVGDLPIGRYVMAEWERVRAFDFGTTNPMAVLDCFIDPMGRIYVYKEIYERGITELDLIPRLTDGINYSFNIGDIAGASEIRNLGKYGIILLAFDQKITEGIVLCRNQMKARSDGTVGLYVNKELAPYTNWELAQAYRYGKNATKEEPEDINNHSAAALRYLIFALRKGKVRQSKGVFG